MAETIKQISVFLENKPNTLYGLLSFLEKNEINLASLNISETDKYGICRLITEDADSVCNLLKSEGYVASVQEIVLVKISNDFGSLKNLIEKISSLDINIEYMYSMRYSSTDEAAYMCIAVSDITKTLSALKE